MGVYPKVVDENQTVEAVLRGKSITRFGDGEFRLAMGGEQNVSQVNHPKLRRELCEILATAQDFCLVAIPNMSEKYPKWDSWKKYVNKYPRLLNPSMTYYSAFISRPDSATVIDKPEYYERIESLWRGKDVVLVRGSERSLVEGRGPMLSANRVFPVICARRDAYTDIDDIEKVVVALNVNRVLLCAGAMATVLAYRLARRGFHALDLGHLGYLWRYYASRKRASNP